MFCPCGSKKPLERCCEKYLLGKEEAPTAESLMRSRYTGYTFGRLDYIEKTMRGEALQHFNRQAVEKSLEATTWLELTVLKAEERGEEATVSFLARFKDKGEEEVMHETSQFKKIEGKWYYTARLL
jgi:SEC-C motif-containing protein